MNLDFEPLISFELHVCIIEVKGTETLRPVRNVKPNLEVMPSFFTKRKTRFVASLKTSPKESKLHFPPHFYGKNLRQKYKIKYFRFLCMEFAIKLPIFMKNTERGVKFPEPGQFKGVCVNSLVLIFNKLGMP